MGIYGDSLNLNTHRRFGAEIEINSFDGKNRSAEGLLPEGTHAVAAIVRRYARKSVRIHKWAYDHNNTTWVVKPDSSCGLEVCSPVLKGWRGIMELCRVIDGFGQEPSVNVDDRCSFHVHVDVSDLADKDVAAILTWWVKCEPVFMDSVPMSRKRNQYCQLLAQSDFFDAEDEFLPHDKIIRILGACKYHTINTYHYTNGRRRTIEFRIMDSECCLDPLLAKNWVRLILHFVERSIAVGMPEFFSVGKPMTGYCWLDPREVFDFLGFSDSFVLSKSLECVRSWFLQRLYANCWDTIDNGVLGLRARSPAHRQIEKMHFEHGEDRMEVLYDESNRF